MKIQKFLLVVLASVCFSCNGKWQNNTEGSSSICSTQDKEFPKRLNSLFHEGIQGALLASRFKNLEEFKSIVEVEYFEEDVIEGDNNENKSMVRLRHCSNDNEVISILKSGLSQDDIAKARDGNIIDHLNLLVRSPFAISNRMELNKIYSLARWKPKLFGEGDVAFYDLAEASVNNINTDELAFKTSRDSSDKGYLNTFNHFTSQAFITALYSEEMADFIADIHELYNMKELTSGKFTNDQLVSDKNNPVDNYVDMINNEWGQEMGKQLKTKYGINQYTIWTPDLLVRCLNEIQSYYSWAFKIGFHPFRREDEVIVRFSKKVNVVMKGVPVDW